MKKNIEDYIFHKENFLDKEYCEKSISELNTCEWEKRISYGTLPVFDSTSTWSKVIQTGIIGSDFQEKAENINEVIIE